MGTSQGMSKMPGDCGWANSFYGCRIFPYLLLVDKGNVWAAGLNSLGQLGFGDLVSRYFPQCILFGLPVKSIHARGKHSAIVVDEENIYTFGSNQYGQLGIQVHGQTPKQLSPPTKVNSLPPISTICLAPRHTFFIDFSGYLWVCGGTNFWFRLCHWKDSPSQVRGRWLTIDEKDFRGRILHYVYWLRWQPMGLRTK